MELISPAVVELQHPQNLTGQMDKWNDRQKEILYSPPYFPSERQGTTTESDINITRDDIDS